MSSTIASSGLLTVGDYTISNQTIADIQSSSRREVQSSRWDRFVLAFLNRFFSTRCRNRIENIQHINLAKSLLWDLFHSECETTVLNSFKQLKELVSSKNRECFKLTYLKEGNKWILSISIPAEEELETNEEKSNGLEFTIIRDFGGFTRGIDEVKCILSQDESEVDSDIKLKALVAFIIDGEEMKKEMLHVAIDEDAEVDAGETLNITLSECTNLEQESSCASATWKVSTTENFANKAYKEGILTKVNQLKPNVGETVSNDVEPIEKLRINSPTLMQDISRDGVTLHAQYNQQINGSQNVPKEVEQQNEQTVQVEVYDHGSISLNVDVEPQVTTANNSGASTYDDAEFHAKNPPAGYIIDGELCQSAGDLLLWWQNNYPNNQEALDAFEAVTSQFVVGGILYHQDENVKAHKMGTSQEDGRQDERLVHVICLGENKLLVVQRFKQYGAEVHPSPDDADLNHLVKGYWGQAIFLIDCKDGVEKEERCKCLSVNVQKENYPVPAGAIVA